MPDLDHACVAFDPADRAGHGHRHLAIAGPDRWSQRIYREVVENVGEQQLLMLLLVMAAEHDQRLRRRGKVRQRRQQGLVTASR
jgi:hypothetical protein